MTTWIWALAAINAGERPLGLYVFGEDTALTDHVLASTHSGGAAVNTCAIQSALPSMGFGGSGMSGMGRHHGIEGFREFSNPRRRRRAWRKRSDGRILRTLCKGGGAGPGGPVGFVRPDRGPRLFHDRDRCFPQSAECDDARPLVARHDRRLPPGGRRGGRRHAVGWLPSQRSRCADRCKRTGCPVANGRRGLQVEHGP